MSKKGQLHFQRDESPLPESLVLGGESSKNIHAEMDVRSQAHSAESREAYGTRNLPREDIHRPPYSRERAFTTGLFRSTLNTSLLW